MTSIQVIFNVLDAIIGLWVLVSLLVPGRNIIKDMAIPMLVIITMINMLSEYSQTRDSIITIVGWIFGTDLAPR